MRSSGRYEVRYAGEVVRSSRDNPTTSAPKPQKATKGSTEETQAEADLQLISFTRESSKQTAATIQLQRARHLVETEGSGLFEDKSSLSLMAGAGCMRQSDGMRVQTHNLVWIHLSQSAVRDHPERATSNCARGHAYLTFADLAGTPGCCAPVHAKRVLQILQKACVFFGSSWPDEEPRRSGSRHLCVA